MSHLFSPLSLRDLTFDNRVFVSPMCQYSCDDGMAAPWHVVHLGARAVGGAGLVMTEAAAVAAEGRISPADLGIWSDRHVAPLRDVTAFVRAQGAVAGIQLAHAGRKASTQVPWVGAGAVPRDRGGWTPIGPTDEPFSETYPRPRAMTIDDIERVIAEFRAAAARALDAGFQVVEVHAAHGYLLHEFLSPLANRRSDEHGGSLENRMKVPLRVARAVREAWPSHWPVFVRISATDWIDGGWTPDDSVRLARALREAGVDLIDCSSGGIAPHAQIPAAPGYQVPFAEKVRREAGIPTIAVGLITEPAQAEAVLAEGRADAVMLARAMLRDPYWPIHAAAELSAKGDTTARVRRPNQYLRAF